MSNAVDQHLKQRARSRKQQQPHQAADWDGPMSTSAATQRMGRTEPQDIHELQDRMYLKRDYDEAAADVPASGDNDGLRAKRRRSAQRCQNVMAAAKFGAGDATEEQSSGLAAALSERDLAAATIAALAGGGGLDAAAAAAADIGSMTRHSPTAAIAASPGTAAAPTSSSSSRGPYTAPGLDALATHALPHQQLQQVQLQLQQQQQQMQQQQQQQQLQQMQLLEGEFNPDLLPKGVHRDMAIQRERRRLAEAVQSELGPDSLAPDTNVATLVQRILKSGVLAHKVVEYRKRSKGVNPADHNKGTLTTSGLIRCSCHGSDVTMSEFEQHSNSQIHRPAEYIFIRSIDMSLKSFAMLVLSKPLDTNLWYCLTCGEGGGLLCCDGCPAAYHTHCLGTQHPPQPNSEWMCGDCRQAGKQPQWSARGPFKRHTPLAAGPSGGGSNNRRTSSSAAGAGNGGGSNAGRGSGGGGRSSSRNSDYGLAASASAPAAVAAAAAAAAAAASTPGPSYDRAAAAAAMVPPGGYGTAAGLMGGYYPMDDPAALAAAPAPLVMYGQGQLHQQELAHYGVMPPTLPHGAHSSHPPPAAAAAAAPWGPVDHLGPSPRSHGLMGSRLPPPGASARQFPPPASQPGLQQGVFAAAGYGGSAGAGAAVGDQFPGTSFLQQQQRQRQGPPGYHGYPQHPAASGVTAGGPAPDGQRQQHLALHHQQQQQHGVLKAESRRPQQQHPAGSSADGGLDSVLAGILAHIPAATAAAGHRGSTPKRDGQQQLHGGAGQHKSSAGTVPASDLNAEASGALLQSVLASLQAASGASADTLMQQLQEVLLQGNPQQQHQQGAVSALDRDVSTFSRQNMDKRRSSDQGVNSTMGTHLQHYQQQQPEQAQPAAPAAAAGRSNALTSHALSWQSAAPAASAASSLISLLQPQQQQQQDLAALAAAAVAALANTTTGAFDTGNADRTATGAQKWDKAAVAAQPESDPLKLLSAMLSNAPLNTPSDLMRKLVEIGSQLNEAAPGEGDAVAPGSNSSGRCSHEDASAALLRTATAALAAVTQAQQGQVDAGRSTQQQQQQAAKQPAPAPSAVSTPADASGAAVKGASAACDGPSSRLPVGQDTVANQAVSPAKVQATTTAAAGSNVKPCGDVEMVDKDAAVADSPRCTATAAGCPKREQDSPSTGNSSHPPSPHRAQQQDAGQASPRPGDAAAEAAAADVDVLATVAGRGKEAIDRAHADGAAALLQLRQGHPAAVLAADTPAAADAQHAAGAAAAVANGDEARRAAVAGALRDATAMLTAVLGARNLSEAQQAVAAGGASLLSALGGLL